MSLAVIFLEPVTVEWSIIKQPGRENGLGFDTEPCLNPSDRDGPVIINNVHHLHHTSAYSLRIANEDRRRSQQEQMTLTR